MYRMDHHCVFLNNCVGAANLRFFLLFLFWVSLATFYVAVCCFITIQSMMVEAKAGRLVVLEELHTKGALPDVRRQLAQGQGFLALIVAVTMPIARVYGDTIGWDCILLLVGLKIFTTVEKCECFNQLVILRKIKVILLPVIFT